MSTRTYIFHHEGPKDDSGHSEKHAQFARLVEVPNAWTADQWGEAQAAFAREACGGVVPPYPKCSQYAGSISVDPCDTTPQGLTYDYDLCRDGGLYRLHAWAGKHTPEQVAEAVGFLRRSFDVVSLRMLWLKEGGAA